MNKDICIWCRKMMGNSLNKNANGEPIHKKCQNNFKSYFKNKEKRPSKKNSKKENKKFPYKRRIKNGIYGQKKPVKK